MLAANEQPRKQVDAEQSQTNGILHIDEIQPSCGAPKAQGGVPRLCAPPGQDVEKRGLTEEEFKASWNKNTSPCRAIRSLCERTAKQ
jgi:hypothetical protein